MVHLLGALLLHGNALRTLGRDSALGTPASVSESASPNEGPAHVRHEFSPFGVKRMVIHSCSALPITQVSRRRCSRPTKAFAVLDFQRDKGSPSGAGV